MKQGVMPFQYEEEKSSTGMTALSGLDIPGVDASGGSEVIGRTPRGSAGERSGLDR